jgi:hypothetical protein
MEHKISNFKHSNGHSLTGNSHQTLSKLILLHTGIYPKSIVSGYGLDDQAIDVRSPAEAKDFSSSLCVQTSSGAHPASCTMGTGVLTPGVKGGQAVTLTIHPHLVSKSRMSRSSTSSPPKRPHGV